MCFVGFNSVPNLIVILFNLLYPIFIVRFNCKCYVRERESVCVCVWRLKQLKTEEFSPIAQTLTTPFQSVKWGFGVAGKHSKKLDFSGCNQVDCGIWRARQDTILRSLVRIGVWSLEGLGTVGKLGLEGLLLTHVS